MLRIGIGKGRDIGRSHGQVKLESVDSSSNELVKGEQDMLFPKVVPPSLHFIATKKRPHLIFQSQRLKYIKLDKIITMWLTWRGRHTRCRCWGRRCLCPGCISIGRIQLPHNGGRSHHPPHLPPPAAPSCPLPWGEGGGTEMLCPQGDHWTSGSPTLGQAFYTCPRRDPGAPCWGGHTWCMSGGGCWEGGMWIRRD